jgi:antitoxin VapB
MSLNIKNEEAHKMAAELAAIRGESMTAVVLEALRKELEAERQKQTGKTKAQRILEAARRFQQGLPEGIHSSDHAWLYGEDGLPR